MIWTKPSTFVALALLYFVMTEVEGVQNATYILFSIFILYLFYRLVTWKR
jgi:hypothetical protein